MEVGGEGSARRQVHEPQQMVPPPLRALPPWDGGGRRRHRRTVDASATTGAPATPPSVSRAHPRPLASAPASPFCAAVSRSTTAPHRLAGTVANPLRVNTAEATFASPFSRPTAVAMPSTAARDTARAEQPTIARERWTASGKCQSQGRSARVSATAA